MAVQHHLDQPLMQINEIDISPGFETQVSVVCRVTPLKCCSRSLCRPPCTPLQRRPRPGSPRRRGAATLTERSCSNTCPMAGTGEGERMCQKGADAEASGMPSATAGLRRRMARCWTGAAARPTTTGALWTCPPSSRRGLSAK